ncbi:MAG: hypothetical protein ACLPYZ_17905 [Limisphaerales bacterium]
MSIYSIPAAKNRCLAIRGADPFPTLIVLGPCPKYGLAVVTLARLTKSLRSVRNRHGARPATRQKGVVYRRCLTRHVWFPVLDYEIMAAWLHQKLDQDGDVGLLSSGKDCWRDFTKVN